MGEMGFLQNIEKFTFGFVRKKTHMVGSGVGYVYTLNSSHSTFTVLLNYAMNGIWKALSDYQITNMVCKPRMFINSFRFFLLKKCN